MFPRDPNRLPLGTFAVAIILVFMATYYLVTGIIPGRYGRGDITREANPYQFWSTVVFFYGAGTALLIDFFHFFFWVYKY